MNLETINGVQLSAHVKAPVTVADSVQVNASAILLNNPGDETVTIDNGFTLSPGQVLMLKTGDDENVITWNFKVTFDGLGINPRLEIIELRVDLPGYGNYQQQ